MLLHDLLLFQLRYVHLAIIRIFHANVAELLDSFEDDMHKFNIQTGSQEC